MLEASQFALGRISGHAKSCLCCSLRLTPSHVRCIEANEFARRLERATGILPTLSLP